MRGCLRKRGLEISYKRVLVPRRHIKTLSTNELRTSFLSYFEGFEHTRVESSGLIPSNDPSLLFTNAGMVQFKDIMCGASSNMSRAVSVQKCLRAGGKHNDLDNVGVTPRHHTFFEMMGNFSFGDYSREGAILYAWRYLTKELSMPTERLGVTVHTTDRESLAIWKRVTGWDENSGKIRILGDEDNFWSMGNTGPCGTCSEIFWDQQEEIGGERWLEIWNLVFMDRVRDEQGYFHPLERACVDTGMGLERIASVLQGVRSNYEIDTLAFMMRAARNVVTANTLVNPKNADLHNSAQGGQEWTSVSRNNIIALRILTDHFRAAAFLISEGVVPSNAGRGYVLRRIIRRAVRYASLLGAKGPVLGELYAPFEATMGHAYPIVQGNYS